jgi:hypothetical protein
VPPVGDASGDIAGDVSAAVGEATGEPVAGDVFVATGGEAVLVAGDPPGDPAGEAAPPGVHAPAAMAIAATNVAALLNFIQKLLLVRLVAPVWSPVRGTCRA